MNFLYINKERTNLEKNETIRIVLEVDLNKLIDKAKFNNNKNKEFFKFDSEKNWQNNDTF